MNKNIVTSYLITIICGGLVPAAWAFDNAALDQAVETGLRDVKAPVYFPSRYPSLLIVLAGIILGLLVLMYFLRPKKKDVPRAPRDTRLPWEIALARLDHLEGAPLLKEGKWKEYYSRLSDIIREYFEDRFKVRAVEMTTEEFLRSLEASRDLTAGQKDTLTEFLRSCDIVKFAKYIPGPEEARVSVRLARQLVRETRATAGSSEQEQDPGESTAVPRPPVTGGLKR
jgi:hypothetical protein